MVNVQRPHYQQSLCHHWISGLKVASEWSVLFSHSQCEICLHVERYLFGHGCVSVECVVCCQVGGLCIGPITRPGENYPVSECVCVGVCVCVCVSLSIIRDKSNHLFPPRHLILRHMSYFLYSKLFTSVCTPATYYWKTTTPIESFTNLQRTGDISVLTPTLVMEWILFEMLAN